MIAKLRAGAQVRAGLVTHVALAAVCYLPLLFTGRGRLAADTRQAIYLDPGRFLSDALSMWDPSRDLGTVTHQNIVLVWPMATYYWLADTLGVPLWLAQRVWTGSILFAAGAGVLYLARTIRWARWSSSTSWSGVGPAVAAFTYAMSPYVLQYVTRTSVLLLPWAALPWLIGLTARSLETRGWRHPALFALITLSIAVNATALALALVGPALWVAWAVWGTRDVKGSDALRTVVRLGVIVSLTSLWWIVALLIEGRYGLPLLDYTETIDQVASTSAATEVLRGLGYWVPYLSFHGYAEVSGASAYLENLGVLALQFAMLVVAFVGIVSIRWRHRLFFGALVVVGVVLGIGAYPVGDPSPLSSIFHDFARSGGVGLALRSTTRAAPLALLGLACLLGAFVDALLRRARRTGIVVALAAVVVAVALAPSIAAGDLVDPLYSRPDEVPGYWTQALATADANAHGTRLLEIPGTRFAAYRWGNTYEPITAGNAATPTAWREQIPYGGTGSADLLIALDNRIQEGLLDPNALAPVARLLGVGQLVVRNDLEYERYETVAPDRVWSLVDPSPRGLGPAEPFGPVGVNEPDRSHLEDDSPRPADPSAAYPALALVPVDDTRELVQVVPVKGTVVLDGSGDGLVDAAGAGVIDGRAPVVYSATTRTDPKLLADVLDHGGRVVLTDTNRRRVYRWRSTNNSTGITLRANEDPAAVNGDAGGEAPLDLFPAAGSSWESVAEQHGATVEATRFGNPLRFEAGVRPAAALDGDRDTGWQVGPTIGGVGDRLTVTLDEPVRVDQLRIAATTGTTALEALDLRFDGGPPERVVLDATSRGPDGQLVTFPSRTFSKLSLEIAALGPAFAGAPQSEAGIAELSIDGVDFDQVVRLPTALTKRLGTTSIEHPLSIVLTRQRGDTTLGRQSMFAEEPAIAREFSLPTARNFSLTGQARVHVGDEGVAGPGAADASVGACRADLVEIDGVPVPVRLGRATDARPGDTVFTVESCAPVELARGSHRLDTSGTSGIDVDQLALASDAGGGAGAVSVDGEPVLPPTPEPVTTTWHEQSSTNIDVRAGASDGPTWVVLGQSHNDGWDASADRGPDPAGPILVNGFANGFYVDAAQPRGASYSLNWTPQRAMDLALLASLVGVLVALVLVLRGRAWRAVAIGTDVAEPLTGPPALGPPALDPPALDPPVLDAPALDPPVLDAPVLDAPWGDRPPVATARIAAAALGLGLGAAFVIGPVWGVAIATIVVVAGRWRHGHAVLTAGTVGAIALALGAVVIDRIRERDANAYDFFTTLFTPHRIALGALALLAADLLLSRARPTTVPRDPVTDLHHLRERMRRPPVSDHLDEPGNGEPRGDEPERTAPGARRRFFLACLLGAVPGGALFTWMLTAGTWRLFDSHPLSDFYDAQAHRLLSGHLDIPGAVLGIEAFLSGGHKYMYQGPLPAIVRFPVALFTDAYDERLAGVSMLVAFAVAAVATSVVAWQVRTLFRGGVPVGRGEAVAVGGFVFACTGASIPVFLASQTSVYHESAMWGLALALATFSALLRHLAAPARWTLALASLLTTLTLWSRASLGLGALAALGLVLLAELIAWLRVRTGHAEPAIAAAFRPRRAPTGRLVAQTLVACAVPLLLYSGLNIAKFGTVASVPWKDQVYTEFSSARREFLAENGDFFGPQFLPTTLVEYLRPDAFSVQDEFPYLGFRAGSIGRLFGYGGVRFDKIDATSSLPVSFPLLGVLGIVGVVGAVAARRRRPPIRAMWAPILGAAASAASIFVFGFIAQRYLSDVWPLLVLTAAAGFVTVVRALGRASTVARAVTIGALVILGVFATWVTVAQGVWYQRVFASPADEVATRRFYETRSDLPTLPFGSHPTVSQGDHLPELGAPGDLFVVGDCDGLYVSSGENVDELSQTNWKPIERTPDVGAFDLVVRFPDARAGTSDPLLVGGSPSDPYVMSVEYLGHGRVRFHEKAGGLGSNVSRPVRITPGRAYHVRLSADPEIDFSDVYVDGRRVFSGLYTVGDVPRLGVNDLDTSTRSEFGGTIRPRPPSTELCRRILAG